MTAIVGIEDGHTAVIGADSIAVGGWRSHVYGAGKVFERNGFVIGCAGDFRYAQLIRYKLAVGLPPRTVRDLDGWMACTFIDAVRDVLKEGGYAKRDGEQEDGDGEMLVGVRGHVFTIFDHFQCSRSGAGYMAIGIGENYALGALHATRGTADAEKRALIALEAAGEHCIAVRAPYVTMRTAR